MAIIHTYMYTCILRHKSGFCVLKGNEKQTCSFALFLRVFLLSSFNHMSPCMGRYMVNKEQAACVARGRQNQPSNTQEPTRWWCPWCSATLCVIATWATSYMAASSHSALAQGYSHPVLNLYSTSGSRGCFVLEVAFCLLDSSCRTGPVWHKLASAGEPPKPGTALHREGKSTTTS